MKHNAIVLALCFTVLMSFAALAEAAAQGAGVALLPVALFARDLASGRLVQPFDTSIDTGRYWLTWLGSRRRSPAMQAFAAWLQRAADPVRASP